MKKYILVDVAYGFKLWTRENYEAYITNARGCWEFTKHNGFNTADDVLEYVEKYFKISRNDIEVKED